MIISVSGTPGTGKTVVAKLLAKKLSGNLIAINSLVTRGKLSYTIDKKRKSKIIDIKKMNNTVKKELISGVNIIEGHLSHFISSDYVFILRASPETLQKRLVARKWSKNKIKENVEAEVVDEITIEAMKTNKNVFEIDTSKLTARKTADMIVDILNKHHCNKYLPGNISWSNDYAKCLLKKG